MSPKALEDCYFGVSPKIWGQKVQKHSLHGLESNTSFTFVWFEFQFRQVGQLHFQIEEKTAVVNDTRGRNLYCALKG